MQCIFDKKCIFDKIMLCSTVVICIIAGVLGISTGENTAANNNAGSGNINNSLNNTQGTQNTINTAEFGDTPDIARRLRAQDSQEDEEGSDRKNNDKNIWAPDFSKATNPFGHTQKTNSGSFVYSNGAYNGAYSKVSKKVNGLVSNGVPTPTDKRVQNEPTWAAKHEGAHFLSYSGTLNLSHSGTLNEEVWTGVTVFA
jgi:hypothetical protein